MHSGSAATCGTRMAASVRRRMEIPPPSHPPLNPGWRLENIVYTTLLVSLPFLLSFQSQEPIYSTHSSRHTTPSPHRSRIYLHRLQEVTAAPLLLIHFPIFSSLSVPLLTRLLTASSALRSSLVHRIYSLFQVEHDLYYPLSAL